jgi:hypothetical protein
MRFENLLILDEAIFPFEFSVDKLTTRTWIGTFEEERGNTGC